MFNWDDDTFDPAFKLANDQIADAIARGVLDNLPGMGKPLEIEEPPPFVSREDWITMKVLFKDAGILPPEVELMRETAQLREELKGDLLPEARAAKVKELREKELKVQIMLDERWSKVRK